MSRRKSIARNSLWFGLESVVDSAVGLALSVVVARLIGPERLGYYIFVMFLVNQVARLSGFGPGAATRKYLAEHLGRGERGLARNVFFTMLRWHIGLGLLFALLGAGLAFAFGEPNQHLLECLLIASVIPSTINIVPSQANMAAENFARNVPSSLGSLAVYVLIAILSLILGWGVVGLAAAMLVRRTLEMVLRLYPSLTWARSLPRETASPSVSHKLFLFSGQSLVIALLLMIVWDRSELFFLRHYCSSKELTFYSVAFSITEALLLLPNVIGSAVSARLLADYTKSPQLVGSLMASSARYLALVVAPLYFGLAALAAPVMGLLYGSAYLPAIPVLVISLILTVPKAFFWLPTALQQASDRQGLTLKCLLGAGALNLALDAAIIPRFGAIGAAIGNGLAQSAAVIALIVLSYRACGISFPWKPVSKAIAAAAVMGAVLGVVSSQISPLTALLSGPILGLGVYLLCLSLSGWFQEEDRANLERFTVYVPGALLPTYRLIMSWLVEANRPASSPNTEKEVLICQQRL